MVVAVLFSAGDHVPVIPLLEVVGNGAMTEPEHTGATWVNVGVTGWFTTMVIVFVVAHWPVTGVNVYVVVAVLLSAGDHEPFMPFVDVVGNGAKVAPAQIGATGLNVGVVLAFTVTTIDERGLTQLPEPWLT